MGGDLFLLWEHRLFCWDSTKEEDVAILMDWQKADLVFTDPPYWVDYWGKNEFLNKEWEGNRITDDIENDKKKDEDLELFLTKAFENIFKFTKDCMSYYITMPFWWEQIHVSTALQVNWLPLRHLLIWNKNNHILWRSDYYYKHEPILYWWKQKGTHKFYWKGEFKTTVWDIAKPLSSDLHPTMKPVKLVANCILNSSIKWDVVLDLFGGSGTTLIACEQLGRKACLMEYEPKYIETIIRRFHELNPDAEIKCLNRDLNVEEIRNED